MKIALLTVVILLPVLHGGAADFARSGKFESVEAFVAAAKTFRPATTKSDLSALFKVRELGDHEDPKTGTIVSAEAIESTLVLWSNDTHALIFVTAVSPTETTRSSLGVLFLLKREKDAWRIADLRRFTATGKEAEVSAELTAGTGTGYRLGIESMKPVVTVKESHGGRGYNYWLSASYTLSASKLKRMELE